MSIDVVTEAKTAITIDTDAVKKIKDIKMVSAGYEDYVAAAVQTGLFELDKKGNFNPQTKLTKAQAIEFIYQKVYKPLHSY